MWFPECRGQRGCLTEEREEEKRSLLVFRDFSLYAQSFVKVVKTLQKLFGYPAQKSFDVFIAISTFSLQLNIKWRVMSFNNAFKAFKLDEITVFDKSCHVWAQFILLMIINHVVKSCCCVFMQRNCFIHKLCSLLGGSSFIVLNGNYIHAAS